MIGVLLVAAVLSGCRSGTTDPKKSLDNADRRHILQMLTVYRAYLNAHNGKPPANTETLKAWAEKEGKDKLNIADAVDTALVSPRDGQPYAFVPPPKGRKMGPQTFMVYEKQGKSGIHFFAGEMGVVGEKNDKELNEALDAAK
jgi:hypothetical protein